MRDDEVGLLAQALGVEPPGRAALQRRVLAVGGLIGLWRAGPEALDSLGVGVARRWKAIQDLWVEVHQQAAGPRVDGAKALVACVDPWLPLRPVESFHAVFLDGRGRFAGTEEVSRGTVDACIVHPREVFAPAIRARAAAVAVVHNHPSGDPAPSAADYALTERLADAGRLLGIPLVDHVVVGRQSHRSLAARGPLVIDEGACDASRRCKGEHG